MATQTAPANRGQWNSKLGFILAAAGSAIGLGNIWRFPYSAGEGGGGAFVLIYLLFVALIGVPVLLAELAIGRQTKRNPVGALRALVPDSAWPLVGGLGVLTGFGILSFYSVIAGWTLSYLWKSVSGGFAGVTDAEASNALFTALIGDPVQAILLTALFLVITVYVVRGGISGGIERATKVLMPLLFLLLIGMALFSLTLDGAMQGVSYLFEPDFSKVNGTVIMTALGQALFSLSLGMGAMITYGSYMPRREHLPGAGATVAIFDTSIALLAGLIIFPALFATGVEPDAGPGLVFVVLPAIFAQMPFGTFFGIAFYFLLAIAALTSTISLLEVVTSYFVDERGWSRNRTVWIAGTLCFILAVPSALAQGGSDFFTSFLGPGLDWLSVQNIIWGNYALSIGALLISLFVGWKWGTDRALASLEAGDNHMPLKALWRVLIKYVCPVAVAIVLFFLIATGNYF